MTDTVLPAPPRKRIISRVVLPDYLVDVGVVWVILGSWVGALGPIAPLMLVSGAAGLMVLRPQLWTIFLRAWPLMLVAGLATLSAVWSSEPSLSARYGAQLAITIMVAMVAAGAAGPTRMLRAFFIAMTLILLICIASGRQGISASGPVLVGILGSKNQMGGMCMFLLTCSLAMLFGSAQPKPLRIAAVPVGLLSAFYLINTFSSGAVMGAALFVPIALALAMGSRLAPSAKFLLALGVLVLVAPAWMVRDDLSQMWTTFLTDGLGKDAGLSGRDYLWAHADMLISDKPILGHGYRSTWLGHSVDTIGLLRWADIPTGEGFNFHNSIREWLVDFGWVGMILIVLTLMVGLGRLTFRAMSPDTNSAVIWFAGIGLVLVVRAWFEYVLGPFGSISIIIIAIATLGYMATPARTGARGSTYRPALPILRRYTAPKMAETASDPSA